MRSPSTDYALQYRVPPVKKWSTCLEGLIRKQAFEHLEQFAKLDTAGTGGSSTSAWASSTRLMRSKKQRDPAGLQQWVA